MKKIILVFPILFFTTILLGQEIRFSVGPIANYTKSNRNNFIIGTAEESLRQIGLDARIAYLFDSKNSHFQLGFGIGYQSNRILLYRGTEGSSDFQGHIDKIQLLSVSFKSMMNLNKKFYLSLDPLLDLQINYDQQQFIDKQTGLGISAGLGKDFLFNEKIGFNIEPRVSIHNLIPFQNAVPTRLVTFGLNLGLTYKNFK